MILQYTPIDLNEIRSGFKALGLLYAVNVSNIELAIFPQIRNIVQFSGATAGGR